MVDGSIIIDTRIDAKGINKGVQGIGKSLNGILNIIKGIGKAMVAAFIGGSIINMFRSIVQEFDIMGSAVGDKFKPLAEALAILKGAFVNFLIQAIIPLIPYIIMAVEWLTNMLQIVTQIVAALFGFRTTVGNIMTTAASNARKAAKEAKGALAAFDQINVLNTPKPEDNAPTGPTATPPPITVTDDILKKVQDLKKLWDAIWNNPLQVLRNIWKMFVDWFKATIVDPIAKWWNDLFGGTVLDKLVKNAIETWKKLFNNTVETLKAVWDNVLRIFRGIHEFLQGVFTGDWAMAWQGLQDIVAGVFGVIWEIVKGALENILIMFDGLKNALEIIFAPVIEWLQEMFDKIKAKIVEAIEGIKNTFGALAKWFFENVWNPIEAGFGSALTGIKQGFEKTFNGIKTFIKGIINSIIDFINGMIEGIVFGINTVIGAANAVGEIVGAPEIGYVDAPQIPRLATGAVIPPNSQFLAVLGDQRSGRNIEAPEGLIRQIMREELGQIQANVQIGFTGNLSSLVRELKPHIDRETVRIGGSLIKSGATTS